MNNPEYVFPPDASSIKTYTGLVQSASGLHKRVLQRRSDLPGRPWLYFPSPEEGGPKTALDSQVSELEEVDPFVNDHLRDTQKALDEARDDLDRYERVIEALQEQVSSTPRALTEDRVREIVRDEFRNATLEVSGFEVRALIEDRAARDREGHDL